MKNGHEEDIQREAPPQSPDEENVQIRSELPLERVSFTSERRKSIHRQSILYPLTMDFLPVGTIVHDTPRRHSSSHNLYSSDVAFGRKLYPMDFKRTSKLKDIRAESERDLLNADIATATEPPSVQVEMQVFPLRFRDIVQEETFCKHFNMYVTNKVRMASRIVSMIHAIMLVAQYLTQTQVLYNSVFVSRVAVIAWTLTFQAATHTSYFRRHFDRLLLAQYALLDLLHQLPRFIFLVSSAEKEDHEAGASCCDGGDLTLFAFEVH
ncbi:unnamed protein product [Phytophthora fragariaefolia]|uniref:Unnamed protein product n=1 Tax=Phytophthora fragariaefolia TaxID=1490495 RepID=A0A9W6XVM5_9STRA|nr:unnamed protein product [Phytophthora fragariaefolia]